ncbi:ABC-2 type transport system ATP-binding protein [Paenibacillus cellulosilyticus]|uniref:ABC-2 type transport system ATP-binding protein n=1 Tax=Paenibacillus cellulosilyticus TaxID=375489 RepID=A0A2V2YT98_9BACL|nr:ABC transporter ATP-binding protein [Paenibacillus cellulosilyticus]PWW02537.1 ABC-2 type transport system ATP-binding protein [Paenibacillus cellulosilyticus]QKS47234.1 ABC transporter ATP-binding protein [Paenibacillus cellulosilyticus]
MLIVDGLTKQFASGRGIMDVSFTVKQGEVFGFLGPNGAGKSTTIRHIMGFMKPDRGRATINGLDCWKEQGAVQRLVGYLPGEIAFIEGMTGRSFLSFLADMQRVDSSVKRARLIERLQFDDTTPIRKMSKGMKQKVGIVAAFMHDPALIILDEPTSGLDPLMQQTFIELVLEEKAKGTTFLMSSHSFPEIERTCDRAAIIKDGRIVAVNDIHELQSLQRKLVVIVFERAEDAEHFAKSGRIPVESRDDRLVTVAVQGNYNELIQETAKYPIRSLDITAQNLEQVFMHYYDRKENAR